MVVRTLENLEKLFLVRKTLENLDKSGNFVNTSKKFILVLNLKNFRAAHNFPVFSKIFSTLKSLLANFAEILPRKQGKIVREVLYFCGQGKPGKVREFHCAEVLTTLLHFMMTETQIIHQNSYDDEVSKRHREFTTPFRRLNLFPTHFPHIFNRPHSCPSVAEL